MMKLDLQLFGATGYKEKNLYSSSHPSTYPYKLAISFVENSINTQNNTSSITATASLTANGQYWTTSYNSILDIYWYDTKTNTRTWKKAISFTGMSGFHDSKSVSIAFDVEHNQDGTFIFNS